MEDREGEDGQRRSGDVTTPFYASPMRSTEVRYEGAGRGTEMVEVGRAR